ncbi:2-methoxy-6-polyprenyl-1,4-benzoquinol methylase, mitochondrial, partial [Cucurbita argyrosperma subsp. sororia]
MISKHARLHIISLLISQFGPKTRRQLTLEESQVMALRSVTRRIGSKIFPMFSSANHLHSHATSFGFKEVPEEEKSRLVGNVFSNVASNYDVMNDLMSAGLHRLWKDRLVSELNPFPGMKHLDVAGGTGDVAFRILESINDVKVEKGTMFGKMILRNKLKYMFVTSTHIC